MRIIISSLKLIFTKENILYIENITMTSWYIYIMLYVLTTCRPLPLVNSTCGYLLWHRGQLAHEGSILLSAQWTYKWLYAGMQIKQKGLLLIWKLDELYIKVYLWQYRHSLNFSTSETLFPQLKRGYVVSTGLMKWYTIKSTFTPWLCLYTQAYHVFVINEMTKTSTEISPPHSYQRQCFSLRIWKINMIS